MSSTPLFRAQALAYATVRQYGSIVLLRPAGLAWLTAVFCLIAAAVLVFLATADYTRKEQADGVLVSAQGLIRVQSPEPGVVAEVRVHEDQAVQAGDVLFVLATQDDRPRRTTSVRASQPGTVGGIEIRSGQSAAAGQALATLWPAGSPLQAELRVSARAAVFAKPGMPVQIRYRAYPFEEFGQFVGTITDISRIPLADAAHAEEGHGEALYRVRVALARQDVPFAGTSRPLMPGMALDASLLLETRKLYAWLLGPPRDTAAKE